MIEPVVDHLLQRVYKRLVTGDLGGPCGSRRGLESLCLAFFGVVSRRGRYHSISARHDSAITQKGSKVRVFGCL